MTGKIAKHLFFTFILSLLLTGFMYAVWFNSKQRGFEEGQALTILFAVGDIFQNLVLTIAALPVFFLTNRKIYNNSTARLLLYFLGPVLLTIVFILLVGNNTEDKIGFLLPGISFIAIHTYFYFKLLHFNNNEAE